MNHRHGKSTASFARRSPQIVAAALFLAMVPAVSGVRPAYAQPAEDPTLKAARARFQEGVEYYDKGQYENARAAFLQAYALRKHPAVLLNLAQSSLKAGHHLDAAKYFKQFLHDSTSITAAERSDAERGLNDARKQLGRIEVSAATGSEVSVDSESVGVAPLSEAVEVEPGTHKVTVRGADGTTDSRTIGVGAGQSASAKFAVGNTATVAPAGGAAPSGADASSAGGDSSAAAGAGAQAGQANPSPGAETKAGGTNLLSPPKTLAPVFVGLGISAAGFITAIAFAIAKSSAQSSAESVRNEIQQNPKFQPRDNFCTYQTPSNFVVACQTLADDNNKVNTDATVANIGLGVGIAGAAFAVGWYLFAPKRGAEPAAAAEVVPLVGPGMRGLSFTGHF